MHIIVKILNTLKAARKKIAITYNGKPIRVTADFSVETLARRF